MSKVKRLRIKPIAEETTVKSITSLRLKGGFIASLSLTHVANKIAKIKIVIKIILVTIIFCFLFVYNKGADKAKDIVFPFIGVLFGLPTAIPLGDMLIKDNDRRPGE